MLKKKFNLLIYIVAIVFILFFTFNGFKLYSIKERDIENNNKVILEEENFNDYSLKLNKDINYNKLYVYKVKNDEFYVFILSLLFLIAIILMINFLLEKILLMLWLVILGIIILLRLI